MKSNCILFSSICIFFILTGCQHSEAKKEISILKEASYVGRVPCADCAGIDLHVKIIPQNDTSGNFHLFQTFIGTKEGDQSFSDSGSYIIKKGIIANPEASVFVFHPQQPEVSRYFERKGDTAILSLNNDGQRIHSKLNYLLKKQ